MESTFDNEASSPAADPPSPPSPLEALLGQDKSFCTMNPATPNRKRRIEEASGREPESLRRRPISYSSPDHPSVKAECPKTAAPKWLPRTNFYTADKHIINGSLCLSDGLRAHFAGCSVPSFYDQCIETKPNQDRLLILHDGPTNSLVVACMDGHGTHGHRVAEFFSTGLESKLCKHPLFRSDICAAIRCVLVDIEYSLFLQEPRIGDFSGCTLCLAVLRGQRLVVANIGDSRAVLARQSAERSSTDSLLCSSTDSADSKESDETVKPLVRPPNLLVQEVSIDHKPSLKAEHARILASGGRVFSIRYPDGTVGPPRVWLANVNAPGLAMSRSLGDFVVHTVGVSSTPDFFSVDLSDSEDQELDCVLVLATDGLWDYVTSQEVMTIAAQSAQPAPAVSKLLNESFHRWMSKERMVDDTTICVVRLQRRTSTNCSDSP